MAERDFYEILGVQRDASQEQIRRAYRELARRYHPDVNKAPDAQARFTEIQEAYDVLSDEKKRQLYDRAGRAGVAGAGAGPWSGQSGARWSSASGGGGIPDLDLDDLGSMFEAFFGGSGRSPHATSSTRHARASSARATQDPVRTDANIPFMTMALGGTHTLTVLIEGSRQSLDVTIPSAIDDGTKLRVRAARGRDRDIILTVRVGEHPVFRRPAGKGLDLEFDLPIRIDEATLGTKVDVPTLEGPVGLTVPPGTPGGRKLRLRGRGLSDPSGRTGDLYALVRIVPPRADTLTEHQASILREIGQTQPDPRDAEHWRPGWSP